MNRNFLLLCPSLILMTQCGFIEESSNQLSSSALQSMSSVQAQSTALSSSQILTTSSSSWLPISQTTLSSSTQGFLSSSGGYQSVSSVLYRDIVHDSAYFSHTLDLSLIQTGQETELPGAFLPWSDQQEGGSSQVTDPYGNCLGHCQSGTHWKIESALFEPWIDSRLIIQNWIPQTADHWGYAYSGWAWFPNFDWQDTNATILQRAKPLGLTNSNTLTLTIIYPKDKGLILELTGQDIDPNDTSSAPPRYLIRGTGEVQRLWIPLSSIKRASWSKVQTYDPKKVTGIKLVRLEAAGTLGANFPQKPASLPFQINCISFHQDCNRVLALNPIFGVASTTSPPRPNIHEHRRSPCPNAPLQPLAHPKGLRGA
jgi:hypothetical protein